MSLIELERVGYDLLGLQVFTLEREDIDDLRLRDIGFVQFLEQPARTNLVGPGENRSRGGTDFGGIAIEAFEKQLLGTALDILQANLGQHRLMQARGIRNCLD